MDTQLLFLLKQRHEDRQDQSEIQSFRPREIAEKADVSSMRIPRTPVPTRPLRLVNKTRPSSGRGKRKLKKAEPYVSPFIAKAAETARQRSISLRPTSAPAGYSKGAAGPKIERATDWNADTKGPGLFDPSLKKQEIFKPQPRNTSHTGASSSKKSQHR